jgi:acyl dehydratase
MIQWFNYLTDGAGEAIKQFAAELDPQPLHADPLAAKDRALKGLAARHCRAPSRGLHPFGRPSVPTKVRANDI